MIEQKKLDGKIKALLDILYAKRFAALERLMLKDLLNKNPYLYRAIGIADASALIEQLLIARISSSDETIFGNDFIEPLALWAAGESDHEGDNRSVTVGAGAGQDIAIETSTTYFAISVKSGINILNSQSGKGQTSEFAALQSRLKKIGKQFRPIIGYGYGRKTARTQQVQEKIAGQMFWALLTAEDGFYIRIADSIGKFSEKHGEKYLTAFNEKKSALLRQFMINFISEDGKVLWDAIVKFNSGKDRPTRLLEHPTE